MCCVASRWELPPVSHLLCCIQQSVQRSCACSALTMDAINKQQQSSVTCFSAVALQYWMADPVLVDSNSPGWSNYSQDQASV